ncbi:MULTISPECIES: ABC transporter substrate-binding protein [unclassified Microbacterium]|uniref:ABC transporter substrate-binding protein n=1 Tax=unclassified Microbacterium TaxID=2609290 RepID=UPI0025F9F4F4|nr:MULTISPECIES: ABC transporter substrate-binding protein [unclassified Microbacterium]
MNTATRPWRRRLLALIPAAALAVVLAACAGAADTSDADNADVDPNGSLTFGYFEPATSLDPQQGTSSQDIPWLLPVYESLFSYSPDGDVAPALAESWELTDTDLTITLRDGLTFHDGTALDADAVVANIERGKELETSTVKGDLATVTSASATDDVTVVLTLSEPDAALPAKLADRAGMVISPAAFGDETNLAIQPDGAGPWKYVSYSPGDRLVVERFDGYWNPDAVMLQDLTIRLIDDDDTRLNAVRAGEVDVAQISAAQVQLASADQSLEVRTDPALAVDQIGLNIAIAPFDDPLVREAINYAIDREALLEGLYRGTGTIAWQPFPPGYYANDPDLEGMYPYDPEKARELLAEAGYPDGFSFDFKTNNQPFRVQATEAIAAMLSDVGIDTNIIPLEGPALLDEFYYQQSVPAYFTPWGGRADPSQTLDNLFGPNGLNNPAKITDPELAALLDEARATGDQEERAALFKEASANIMETSRMIPLMFPGVTTAVRDNVVGYSTGVTGKANFLNVGVTADGS